MHVVRQEGGGLSSKDKYMLPIPKLEDTIVSHLTVDCIIVRLANKSARLAIV